MLLCHAIINKLQYFLTLVKILTCCSSHTYLANIYLQIYFTYDLDHKRHYSILNLKPVMEDPTLLSCCNVLPIMLYYLANFYFTYYDINPKTLYHNKHSSVFQSCSRLWRTPLNNFKRLQCTTLSFFRFFNYDIYPKNLIS